MSQYHKRFILLAQREGHWLNARRFQGVQFSDGVISIREEDGEEHPLFITFTNMEAMKQNFNFMMSVNWIDHD